MNPIHDPEELSRQFNEDEAVWRCFEEKRWLRRRLGSPSGMSEEQLDRLDWSEAEREIREIRVIGTFFPVSSEN